MSPWRRDFGFDRAVPALAVGATSGVLSIIRALSVSALIFVGDLEPYAAQGTQLGLVSAIVLGLVMAFASSYPGTIAMAQIEPAAILALVAAAIITLVGAGGDADTAFATMTVAIAAASLVFGATLFLLGAFRIGNLVRFIPFPVVAGFLAGVGWLLVRGSFTTLTSYPLGFEHLPSLSDPVALGQWIPGIAFGLLLWFLQRRVRHYLVMPTVMAVGIAGFYAVAGLTQSDSADLRNRGYLFEAGAGDSHWQPPWVFFHNADWQALAETLPTIGTMIIIGVLAFLLLAGSLEVATRRDIDLNRELRATGIANMIGAGGAAFPGFHSLSGSILAHRMGAPVRLTGLIASLVCLVAFFLGADAMLWLPKTIIGGILFYLGLDLLLEWAYDTRLRLSRSEYALVLVVLAITGAIGMLEGIGAGILIGVVLFVVNYSRTSVVRHSLSGAEFHSNVDRPERQRAHLEANGGTIHVLRLQGYIFFGTASRLLALVRARLDDRSRPQVQFVVLDFTRVIGLDSSATLGFARMAQYAQDRSFQLVFSGLSPELAHQLGRERIGGDSSANVRFFPDLDHAMEWCEDRLLAHDRGTDSAARDPLADQLRRIAGSAGVDVQDFLSFLEPFAVNPGESVIRQSEESNDLFFIETGKVSIRLKTADGREARLRSIGAGTVVGEVAFYLDVPRSASVVADLPTAGYRLTRANLERLRVERPDLAAMFHEFIAHRLAARVAETARLIDTLVG
ncbi:MAG: cyclic nucleotide-binding domain-containing protein [Rhodospirillales bacterium]|nr:cyclic nucleotide-binding domain-containing protein [Rhodospirillales bacterium]